MTKIQVTIRRLFTWLQGPKNWMRTCSALIVLQAILTISQTNIFPFSDHGIFQYYRKINNQPYFRFKENATDENYIQDGILFEKSNAARRLYYFEKIPLENWKDHLHFEYVEIFLYTIHLDGNRPYYSRTKIYED